MSRELTISQSKLRVIDLYPRTQSEGTKKLEQDEVEWHNPVQYAKSIVFHPSQRSPLSFTEMVELTVSTQEAFEFIDVFVDLRDRA